MKLEKEFNEYLADLVVWTTKLHNIHWNVRGEQFVQVHEYTEAEYDKAFVRSDDVAEFLRKQELTPVSTLKEYLKISHIEEVEPKAFEIKEAFEIVLADMEHLRKHATELRNAADEEGLFTAVAILEDHVADYDKQIWFLKSILKK